MIAVWVPGTTKTVAFDTTTVIKSVVVAVVTDSAEGQSTQGRYDLEIEEGRRAEFVTRKEGAEIVRAIDPGQRIDHNRAVDDDHNWRRCRRPSRSPRAAARASSVRRASSGTFLPQYQYKMHALIGLADLDR